VPNEIISYQEMCRRERSSLQRGMNFGLGSGYSVILMSLRPGAPYEDRIEADGMTLIYEGHDAPRTATLPDPKIVDQPESSPGGTLTQNGRFHQAAQDFRAGRRPAERVRVYEELRSGIWSYNGVFDLIDSWKEHDGRRQVFKFKLMAVEVADGDESRTFPEPERRRIIPTEVKLEVWRRDGGKCVMCGATDELHFDHILPYSKGGTSTRVENVQLLCARHNLEKRDEIV
jgi:hypothetical protein